MTGTRASGGSARTDANKHQVTRAEPEIDDEQVQRLPDEVVDCHRLSGSS